MATLTASKKRSTRPRGQSSRSGGPHRIVPSAEYALEEIRLRFAFRLKTVDAAHPLVPRMIVPNIERGRGAGTPFRPRTKVQLAAREFPAFDRPLLIPKRFTPGCRVDPTEGMDKKKAAEAFEAWWKDLDPWDWAVFTDGSRFQGDLGYGYAIYRGGEAAPGYTDAGGLDPCAVVFDAEALGALRGLQKTTAVAPATARIWVCVDNTAAIWCLRGTASNTSQKHFLQFHKEVEGRVRPWRASGWSSERG